MGSAIRGIGLLAAAAALALPTASPAAPPGLSETNVAVGLTQPTAIAFLPDGGMLVTQKAGALKLVRGGSATTLKDFSDTCSDVSMGLLGVAVDPNFAANGFVYVYRTRPGAGGCATATGRVNQVVRVTLSADAIVPGSEEELLPDGVRTDNGQHNGGTLRIGLDGKLYVSTGDTGVGDFPSGGPGTSTNPFAQDLSELPGKLLRINLDGSPPPDNPFAGTPGARAEVYAYGFRNPFRFGIDPVTGRPWVGDVGQETWEELNVIQPGGNYGWPYCEGPQPPGCGPPTYSPLAYAYQRTPPGTSITGGAFAPCSYGPYGGRYFFGDYVTGKLFSAAPNAARDGLAGPPAEFLDGADGPVDVVFNGGALYFVAIDVGQVRRIVAPPGACPAETAGTGGGPQSPNVSADRLAPRFNLRFKRRQRLDRVSISVSPDEPATIAVTATIPARGTSKTFSFKRVRRSVPVGKRTTIRLRLRRDSLRRVHHLLRRHRLSTKLRLTLADSAGNTRGARAKIRLLRRR